MIILDKKVGETPLECLERYRASMVQSGHCPFLDMPLTYAGRLDPMAEGKLLVLTGDECKNKDPYLGLDKEYEIEILFGVETDTQDVLGKIETVCASGDATQLHLLTRSPFSLLQKYVGTFSQKYPAYSSKTIAGKALHTHAREGTLDTFEKMPERAVEIYAIDVLGTRTMTGAAIVTEILEKIALVKGDFRQEEIVSDWKIFGHENQANQFTLVRLRVTCSSGTYMRTLAKDIGTDLAMGAIAYSIKRTKIGEY